MKTPGGLWGGWRSPSEEEQRRRRHCSLCTDSTTENTEEDKWKEPANQRNPSVSSGRMDTQLRYPAPLPIKHCNSSSWPGVMGPAANQKPHTSLQANGVSRTLPLHSPSSPIMGPSAYVTCLLPPLTPP
uniref:Uncharacterized protein n=1 Tax=Gasterosteus aculeatus TaxID=69293 RepID=G3PS43_GASAC